MGFGFRVSNFRFRVSGRVSGCGSGFSFGFLVSGSGFQAASFGSRVSGFGFRVSDFGFRVSCFELRVSGVAAPDGSERGPDCDKARRELQAGPERPHGEHQAERAGLEDGDVV